MADRLFKQMLFEKPWLHLWLHTMLALCALQAVHAVAALKKQDLRKWNIIDGVSGVLKPGSFTLLLGTPGSGKSVLMKALAGRLGHEKTIKVGHTLSSWQLGLNKAFVFVN